MSYEDDRLNALRALDLLDTPPSESFDRITRMAAQVFGLPIAAVSLTDTDRQWFKSRVGVDHWQIPRELAPCGEVADSCSPLVIRDFQVDEDYKNSNLARSGVRFYAGAPLVTREGYGLGAMCVLGTEPRDVTEQELNSLKDLAAMVMAQIELQHAFGRVDPTTRLPNRHQMSEDIDDAARDHPGEARTVVFVDLIPVQQVSDALRAVGPSFLDDLARTAVQVLKDELPGTRLYSVDSTHLGFMLGTDNPDEMYRVAELVRKSLSNAQQPGGVSLVLRPAVGMSPFRLGSSSSRDVLRFPRSAAQDARDLDKSVAVYSDDQDEAHKRRFTLLTDMPAALQSDDQLHLVFQPRVDLRSHRCVGAEALLRWNHPVLGPVPPGEFIPVIEQTGLARPLTDRVIRSALAQIAVWKAQGRDLVVSVNVSAVNLDEEDFTSRLLSRLAEFHVDPASLELELTESALVSNGQRAIASLEALRAAGLRIAVDDFGTGYSSLSYLKRIPAHCVKIDRSFIQGMIAGSKDLQLVSSMINMLHGMGFTVVAEGVETAEAFGLLQLARCDEAQGYLLARPLAPVAFETWLTGFSDCLAVRAQTTPAKVA